MPEQGVSHKKITPKQIRRTNRKLIYDYIYRHGPVSQMNLAVSLRLSRPTVASNLTDLEENGLISKTGQIDSDNVGRKASAYQICPQYKVSIGVDILEQKVRVVALSLRGKIIAIEAYPLAYSNEDAYYRRVCELITGFIHQSGFDPQQILGIGVAVPGLVSPDGTTVTYGKILSCTGLNVDSFSRHLPYPCILTHDANASAVSELWVTPELTNAVVLVLNKHLGASVISNGQIQYGKHGHTGTVEHMLIYPKGRLCYCGKRGCLETLISISALLKENETLEDFFRRRDEGDKEVLGRWVAYMEELAKAVNNLHLVNDVDIVLAGDLSGFLKQSDIDRLYELVRECNAFEEESDFIFISRMPEHYVSTGAGLYYISRFLDNPV